MPVGLLDLFLCSRSAHCYLCCGGSDTSEERLRFLLIDSRPDIWTVLFNFAKRRDSFGMMDDFDSPRVRREVRGGVEGWHRLGSALCASGESRALHGLT